MMSSEVCCLFFFFFFQAEDGIRDYKVTGVQTCALPLCDLLGIEYPIVQSGMGGVAGPELVAEVCRAGGLGILAGLNVPPDDLRKMIRHVRELTDRPFGVNLWLHKALRPPIDPGSVPEETLRGAQTMLGCFRKH